MTVLKGNIKKSLLFVSDDYIARISWRMGTVQRGAIGYYPG